MTPCPTCSAQMKISKSHINSDGQRQRQRSCKNCGRVDVVGSRPEEELWVRILRCTHESHSVSHGVESSKEVARVQA